MNTELEDALADALRAKAGAVPHSPMPPLGAAAATPVRRVRLVPIAAAVIAAAAVAAATFVLAPGDETPPPPAPVTVADSAELAQGEVYYSLRLSAQADGAVIMEKQLWQPREQAGEWRQQVVAGRSISDGRAVPSGRIGAQPGGVCYPAFTADDASCTAPGSWLNPTVDFLATAPRDPTTLGEQLSATAAAQLRHADVTEDVGIDVNLMYLLELRCIGEVLASNGVPAELSSALRQVVAATPGIEVTERMANLTGEQGTGYSLRDPQNMLRTVIFDANDRYLGSPSESVRHGIAPGLGQPPSRMLD